ncbi:hypothetical protein BT67DRAFT_386698 [Trichocladium antarcticum]|uniref:Uncharacterized protein n=1 Tax=Trichocladium antarcticum TaxID=1450529 RepID=A0AAN6UFS6_9PEZI|nr:hypothetical protein BT67DRAFT_386698 [Trichocladium antarcticum]
MAGITLSTWPPQARGQSRRRRTLRQTPRRTRAGVAKPERPPRRMGSVTRHQPAVTAIVAATMLAFIPFRKALGPFDRSFAHQSKLMGYPGPMGLRSCPPVENRLPYAREYPCPFRTRLDDDSGTQFDFDSTSMFDPDDIRFDDTQCISIGRSTGKPPRMPGAPEPAAEAHESDQEAEHYNDDDDDDGASEMETMNMPFWHLTKPRQKRHSHHAGDTIPDDMSIISDVSLIPTYFPSDIMKQQQQQQQRPHHRAVLKRLIVAKARSARQTMRHLKRTVGNVFVEPPTAHQPTRCVRVGAAAAAAAAVC